MSETKDRLEQDTPVFSFEGSGSETDPYIIPIPDLITKAGDAGWRHYDWNPNSGAISMWFGEWIKEMSSRKKVKEGQAVHFQIQDSLLFYTEDKKAYIVPTLFSNERNWIPNKRDDFCNTIWDTKKRQFRPEAQQDAHVLINGSLILSPTPEYTLRSIVVQEKKTTVSHPHVLQAHIERDIDTVFTGALTYAEKNKIPIGAEFGQGHDENHAIFHNRLIARPDGTLLQKGYGGKHESEQKDIREWFGLLLEEDFPHSFLQFFITPSHKSQDVFLHRPQQSRFSREYLHFLTGKKQEEVHTPFPIPDHFRIYCEAQMKERPDGQKEIGIVVRAKDYIRPVFDERARNYVPYDWIQSIKKLPPDEQQQAVQYYQIYFTKVVEQIPEYLEHIMQREKKSLKKQGITIGKPTIDYDSLAFTTQPGS